MTRWPTSLFRVSVLAALTGVTLSACVVVPANRHVYSDGGAYPSAGGPVYTDVPPPAPYEEAMPALPYAGAVWIGGYWNWYGGRYSWVPGRWTRGHPGRVWVAPRYVPYGRGWHYHGGHWR